MMLLNASPATEQENRVVTSINLKAFANSASLPMLETNEPAGKPVLFLDECVTRRLVIDEAILAKFEIVHSVDVVGWGASDYEIYQHMLKKDYTLFVTIDYEFYSACIVQKLPASLISDAGVITLPTNRSIVLGACGNRRGRRPPLRENYTPKKQMPKKQIRMPFKRMRKHARRRILDLYFKLQALRGKTNLRLLSECSICGWQCVSPMRLLNHKNRTHARLNKWPIVGPIGNCMLCGQKCKGYVRLRNHLINSHDAELAQWRKLTTIQ